jgi:hypothetical protein
MVDYIVINKASFAMTEKWLKADKKEFEKSFSSFACGLVLDEAWKVFEEKRKPYLTESKKAVVKKDDKKDK